MSWVLIVAIVVIVLLGLWVVLLYSGLIRKRNRVDVAWAQIEAQLKRRHGLGPNPVGSDLEAQPKDTDEKIATSRQAYNDAVVAYNRGIRTLPASVLAGMLGFSKRDSLEIGHGDGAVPTVGFTPPAVPPAAVGT